MKSVLITGTSKGIGLESALAFGRAGYKVSRHHAQPVRSLRSWLKRPREKNCRSRFLPWMWTPTSRWSAPSRPFSKTMVRLTCWSTMPVSRDRARWKSFPWPLSGRSWRPTISERSVAFRLWCRTCGNAAADASST